VFLFVLARLRAFMAEDKMKLDEHDKIQIRSILRRDRGTNLCAWTSEVRTKHDNPGSVVREFLSTSLEAILKEFEVATATVATLLVLDFILNDKRLVRNVNCIVERGRDGVVGCDALCDETVVALHDKVGRCFD
jgi:hypothetical protein